MTATVRFYFDVVCPYAYLASTQIERVCAEAGASLEHRPILLGGLFRAIGQSDDPNQGMPAAKAAMNRLDLLRWADLWGVPLSPPAHHPMRSVLAMRAVIASGDVPRAARRLFDAYWRDGLDITDGPTLAQALDEVELPGAEIVQRAASQPIKDELRARTDEAVAAGAFGVPTFVVERGIPGGLGQTSLIWGQDRLHFVTKAIEGTLDEVDA
ncbi:MAG: 2-hydroxychromene-2-carboxylate isomerase [Polyangiaceae bacterium]